MFNNIGGKIKTLAKVLCWLGIIISVLSGIGIMVGGGAGQLTVNGSASGVPGVLVGILVIVIGCLASWIGSFFAYGFGQLIENSDAIRDSLEHKSL